MTNLLDQRRVVLTEDGKVEGVCITLGAPSISGNVYVNDNKSLDIICEFLNKRLFRHLGEIEPEGLNLESNVKMDFNRYMERYSAPPSLVKTVGVLTGFRVKQESEGVVSVIVEVEPSINLKAIMDNISNYAFAGRTTTIRSHEQDKVNQLRGIFSVDLIPLDPLWTADGFIKHPKLENEISVDGKGPFKKLMHLVNGVPLKCY